MVAGVCKGRVEHRGSLEYWNYSVWHCNSGHMSLHIYSTAQGGNFNLDYGVQSFICISIGSSIIVNNYTHSPTLTSLL